MLIMIEKFNALISGASSDADLVGVLREICSEFRFRDAYIVDYPSTSERTMSVLDTRGDRLAWWMDNVVTPQRTVSREVAAVLAKGGVIKFDGLDTMNPEHELLLAMQQLDLVQITMVPIKYDQELVGLVGYGGWPELSKERETILQFLTYNLLAQKRALRLQVQGGVARALTPREREVMYLAAQGKTSNAIAQTLGMAARTVNQHVENVGAKLGTRNRAHTVAEAIRQHMLT